MLTNSTSQLHNQADTQQSQTMQSSTFTLKSVQDDGEDITIILLAIPKNIYVSDP